MFRFRSSAIALLVVNLAAVARADWEQALIWRLRNRSGHDLNLWAESHDGRVGASREPEGDQPAVVAELVRRSRHGAGLPAHGFTVEPGETVRVRVVPLHPRPGDPRIRKDPRRYQIEPGEVIQLQQSRAALSAPVNLEGSYVLADDSRRAGAALVWDISREPPVLVVDEYKDPSRHLLAEPGAPITLGPADWLRCVAGRVLILKPLSRE